jgi:hypothetical protein
VGRAGSRRLDCVPGLSRQVKDFLAATKVHPNVFGIDRGSGTTGTKHKKRRYSERIAQSERPCCTAVRIVQSATTERDIEARRQVEGARGSPSPNQRPEVSFRGTQYVQR